MKKVPWANRVPGRACCYAGIVSMNEQQADS